MSLKFLDRMDIDFDDLIADIPEELKELAKGLSEYVDLKTDFGFKRIFGVKEVMLSFLNTFLKIEGGITDLTYINTEILGLTQDDRKSIFDLICLTGKGEYIVVEMQNLRQEFYKDRTVLYASMLILQQALKGKRKDPKTGKEIDWNYRLPPVYVINILNFKVGGELVVKQIEKNILDTDENPEATEQKYASYIQLMDVETKKLFYDKLTLVYIELERFTKKLKDVKSFPEQWIYLIKHLHELKGSPEELNIEVVEKILEIAKTAKMSKYEVMIYLKNLHDMGVVRSQFNKMSKTIAEQRDTIAGLQGSNTALQSSNTALQNENAELRRRLGIN